MQAIENFLPIYLILVYGYSIVEFYLIGRLANLCRFLRDTISQQNLTKWRRRS